MRRMYGQHYYKQLDETSKVEIEIDMRKLAELVDGLNYGTHRFLSHLLDVRRDALRARVAGHRARGHEDVAESAERAGDVIVKALEDLFKDPEAF